MKDIIRNFVLGLEVDDVGFASVDDYQSPRTPSIESLFPSARSYRVARYVESQLGSPSVTVPVSYPMDFTNPQKIGLAEVSLRHAAVSAGLGAFGLHNLVVHPKLGTRVIFTAVLTKLELASDSAVEPNTRTGCGLCVRACPAGALDDEGKTDMLKYLPNSQPYGMGANIGFWCRLSDATPEEQKAMLQSPMLAPLATSTSAFVAL